MAIDKFVTRASGATVKVTDASTGEVVPVASGLLTVVNDYLKKIRGAASANQCAVNRAFGTAKRHVWSVYQGQPVLLNEKYEAILAARVANGTNGMDLTPAVKAYLASPKGQSDLADLRSRSIRSLRVPRFTIETTLAISDGEFEWVKAHMGLLTKTRIVRQCPMEEQILLGVAADVDEIVEDARKLARRTISEKEKRSVCRGLKKTLHGIRAELGFVPSAENIRKVEGAIDGVIRLLGDADGFLDDNTYVGVLVGSGLVRYTEDISDEVFSNEDSVVKRAFNDLDADDDDGIIDLEDLGMTADTFEAIEKSAPCLGFFRGRMMGFVKYPVD